MPDISIPDVWWGVWVLKVWWRPAAGCTRARSSVEELPVYTRAVGGSNPSAPTVLAVAVGHSLDVPKDNAPLGWSAMA